MIGLKKCKKNIFKMNKLSLKLQKIKKSQQNPNFQTCILTKISICLNKIINSQEIKNKKNNRIILDFKSSILRISTGTGRKIRVNILI